MKKIALIVLFCFVGLVCAADIPANVALKTYTPTFIDWVIVFFNNAYRYDTVRVKLLAKLEKIDNKYRIVFVGGYTGDFGREWYREVWPVIKKNIERNCQTWTSGGYPISLNDISFEVKRY